MNTDVDESEGLEVIHLDLDCFYASVEVRDDPSLVGLPVIVGGTGPRGVVASASYEARANGVRSAMPTAQACAMCPNGCFVSGRREAYEEASHELVSIFKRYTPVVETIALDEAYLDVSGAHRLHGTSAAIAHALRGSVGAELSLSCSVGVGRTKLIAKLASNAAKPTPTKAGPKAGKGVVIIAAGDERPFLHGHPLRVLPGVGPRTAERLTCLGIATVAELATLEQSTLVAHFGKAQGSALFDLAQGVDHRTVSAVRASRSFGHETTFEVDIFDPDLLAARVRELAGSVASRCRKANIAGKTVSLKVKFGDFSLISRAAKSGPRAFTSGAEIAAVAVGLLGGVDIAGGVRLIGVSLSGLEELAGETDVQLALFSENDHSEEDAEILVRHGEVEVVTDEIRSRFGQKAISRASSSVSPSVHSPSGTNGTPNARNAEVRDNGGVE